MDKKEINDKYSCVIGAGFIDDIFDRYKSITKDEMLNILHKNIHCIRNSGSHFNFDVDIDVKGNLK